MTFTYATFCPSGDCKGVASSPVDLGWGHLVAHGTSPDAIYLEDDCVKHSQKIEISVERTLYLSDGADAPVIDGLPDDAFIAYADELNSDLTSRAPTVVKIQARRKYLSNPITLRFDTLSAYQAEFCDKIDAQAGAERLQHITDAPGQSEVYAAKRAEAQAMLSGQTMDYAYVSDMDEAELIIQRSQETEAALAEIEGRRLGAKSAIREAQTVQEILSAYEGYTNA